MHCLEDRRDIFEKAQFFERFGLNLEVISPDFGKANPHDSKFCRHGNTIGSMENLGPEAAYNVMDQVVWLVGLSIGPSNCYFLKKNSMMSINLKTSTIL